MLLIRIYRAFMHYFKHFVNSFAPYKIEVNGKKFSVKYTFFWENVKNGKWEPDTFKVFDKFLDKKHSFIDMGAWIGPTTLYGAHSAKHCYSIEPDPVAFGNLKKNVSLNPALAEKIKIFDCCISDKTGPVKFGNPEELGNSGSSMLFADSKRSISVSGVTLEEFVETNKINDCNFIKIDIEGGEIAVLPNIKAYLEKIKPTLYLSLHPTVFQDLDKDFKVIKDTLKIYANIYNNKGEKLTLDEIDKNYIQKRINYEIVVTDKIW